MLVPCYPSGVTYDLFECLSDHLDMSGLGSVPLYFISPVADSSLAYSNIYSEWLVCNLFCLVNIFLASTFLFIHNLYHLTFHPPENRLFSLIERHDHRHLCQRMLIFLYIYFFLSCGFLL